MKQITFLSFCLILIIALSCAKKGDDSFKTDTTSSLQAQKSPVIDTSKAFKAFLSKYRILALPLIVKRCEFSPVQSQLPELNQNSDTLFIRNGSSNFCYGLLADTSKFYAVLTMAPGDCFGPLLTTFTKDGKRISKAGIDIGRCGFGEDFICSEFMKINESGEIYVADTISTKGENYVIFKNGKINFDGQVVLSEESRISLED